MSRHVIAFTYEPKIKGVRAGTITQTIRPPRKRPIKKGDTLLLHGWEEQPYRSKWSWRMEVVCSEIINIEMDYFWGIRYEGGGWERLSVPWDSRIVNVLAIMDGITPGECCSAGVEMKNLFRDMYGVLFRKKFQIIQWGDD